MRTDSLNAPRWMHRWLLAAGVYNILWGTWANLFPQALFHWLAMPEPNYPEFWQCIGMVVGVYGVGYIIAASDPFRHWPVVLAGFLGKVLGPVGLLVAVLRGRLPISFGLVNVMNDLIWWIPFAMILLAARRHAQAHRREANPPA